MSILPDLAVKKYVQEEQIDHLTALLRGYRTDPSTYRYWLLRELATPHSIGSRRDARSATLKSIVNQELEQATGWFDWTIARKRQSFLRRYILAHENPDDIEALIKEMVPHDDCTQEDVQLVHAVVHKLAKEPAKYTLTVINLLEYIHDYQDADSFGVKALQDLSTRFALADSETRKRLTRTLIPLAQRYHQQDLELGIHLQNGNYEIAVDRGQELLEGDTLTSFYRAAYDRIASDKKSDQRYQLMTELCLLLDDHDLLLRTRKHHLEWLLRQPNIEIPLELAEAVADDDQLIKVYRQNIEYHAEYGLNVAREIKRPNPLKAAETAVRAYSNFPNVEFANAAMTNYDKARMYHEALAWSRKAGDENFALALLEKLTSHETPKVLQ
ncbi:hypothetical protein HYY69_08075 [Candidatus Woesearchaeota archaeon]|nr:hypothetical protein [Candidatus Woesearchaeota archaeon]